MEAGTTVVTGPANPQFLLKSAAEHRAHQRLDEAETAYRSLLELQPNNLPALLGLGTCARQRGDRAAALQWLQEAAVAHPTHPQPLLEIAAEHRARQQFAEAEALYRSVLEMQPNNLPALLNLGTCARQCGNRTAALTWFQAAAVAHPDHPQPLLEMATEHRVQERFAEAAALYRSVLEMQPDNLPALLGLGTCARQRGDRDGALQRFQAAAAAHPNHPQPLLEMATEHRVQERFAEAEALYQSLLEMQPNHLHALMSLGTCARQRGNRPAALTWFQAAAAAHPDHPQPLLEMATEHRAYDRLDEAEALYRSVLEMQPNHLQGLLGLGGCARQRGDRTTARQWFQAAAATHPDHPQPLLEMATEHRAYDRLDEAEALYRSVLEMQPNHLQGMLGLGGCARQRGGRAGALQWFEAAATAHPAHPQPLLEMATEHRAYDRLDEAEALYRSVLEMQPNHLQGLLGLGGCARQRRDRVAALQMYQAAASVHPCEVQPLLEMATEHRAQERLDEAEVLYRTVLEARPSNLHALLGLGGCARQRGDRVGGLQCYQAAASAYPRHPQPIMEIATAQLELGRPESSRETVERVLLLDPDNISAVLTLARLERVRYCFDRSLRLLEGVFSRNPNNVQVLMALAYHWSEAGFPEKSVNILNGSSYPIGSSVEIDLHRAELFRKIGQLDQALSLVRAIIKRSPWNFNAHIICCELMWSLNGKEESRKFFAQIQGYTASEIVTIYCVHAKFQEYDGDIKASINYYEKSLLLQPSEPKVHDNLARIHLFSLDTEKSKKHLKILIEKLKWVRVLQGQSVNISQNFVGQILDDILLERDGLKILKDYRELAADKRIPRLLEFIQEYPDYTAGAMQFVLALAEDGWVDRWPSSGSCIPKTIVQYWDDIEIPDYLKSLSDTWKRCNPTYRHLVFNDHSATEFMHANHSPEVTSAYLRAAEPAQKADIFRLAYLFVEGGYYADMDDRCLCSLDEFLPRSADFIGWKEQVGAIGNNFMAVPARSPIISSALRV